MHIYSILIALIKSGRPADFSSVDDSTRALIKSGRPADFSSVDDSTRSRNLWSRDSY